MGIGTPKSSTAIKEIIKKLFNYYSRRDLSDERKRVLRFYLLGDCATDINYRLRQPLQSQYKERGAINNFIDSRHQSLMLLLGDAGAGKSAYTQWLVNYFCQNNNDETYPGYIPIRIELKAYNEISVKDVIAHALRTQFNFSEQEIAELKQLPDVVFLLDGYDEISGHSKINIYKENQCLKNWPKAKVLITCRNGHFKDEAECKELFDIPAHKYAHQSDTSYADLLYLAPFDGQQIERYLDQFVKSSANFLLTTADIEYAKSLIKQHENLKVVVQNPFVLQIFAETFPNLLKKYGSDISKIVLSDIYEQFLEDWFIHAKERLKESINLSEISKKVTDLKRCFYNYAQAFAYELFAIGKVEIIYTPKESHDEFEIQEYIGHKAFEHFFKSRDTNPKTVQESQKLLDAQRVACPLRRKIKDIDDEYSFIHKSYQDYLAANYLFTLIYDRYRSIKGQHPHNDTQNVFKNILNDPNHVNYKKLLEVLNALNKRYLTEDRLVLRFLSERLEKLPFEEFEALSEELLLPMIQNSAKDKSYDKAASSIMSTLSAARKSMSGWDLRGISIPKADLSRAILHRTNFTKADLREVKFNQAYMAEANLSYSQMKDVQFGELPYLKFNKAVKCLSFSPDGKTVAVGQGDKIFISEVITGKTLQVLQGHKEEVTSVAFGANSTTMASGSEDRSVRLWDTKSGKELHTLQGHSGRVGSVAFDLDGKTLVSGSHDRSVRLWDAKSGTQLQVLQGHSGRVTSVALSSDGTTVASGSRDKSVRLWDAKNGTQLQVLQGHSAGVNSVALSSDGTTVASGSWDKSVRLWDAKSGTQLQVLQGHSADVYSVAFSADGAIVASGSWDNSVRLWDARSGKALQVLQGHGDFVNSVATSSDGTTVASGSMDKSVRLWDARSGTQLQVLQGHSESVRSVAISADGTTVASGSMDKSVRLWDVKSGKELQVLHGHCSSVFSVAISTDGSMVASGSWDNSVRLWDAKSGKELQVLQGHTGPVISVAFSSGGAMVASGSLDKTIRIWDTTSYQCITVMVNGVSILSISFNTQGQLISGDGSPNNSVRSWQLINHQWCLKWSSPQQILCLAGCNIEDVKDLSDINRRLIEQRASKIDLSLPLLKNNSVPALAVAEIPSKNSSTSEDDELSSAPTSIPLKPTAVISEKPLSTKFQVKMRYEYEDSDINTLLEIKIKEISNTQGIMNYVLGAVDNIVPNQLQRGLQSCVDELQKKPSAQHNQYNLLIPFNLGCYHWVSLLIRLDANFKATKIVYCDSLKKVTQVPESITTAINKLWPNIPVTLVELFTQPDMKSCGVLAIVNLMNIIQERNESKKLTEDEVKELRRSDLLLVKDKRPAYFDSFYQRQLANRPSIAAIPEQVAMLSQEVKFSPQEYKRIMQGYELIKDIRDSNLKQILQACLKDKEKFNDKVHLYLQQIREGFNKILSQNISQADKQNVNRVITLFFGFEPEETPLTDIGDSKFRLEHEELRMVGKLLNGEDIQSLKEFTQAVDAQIKADEVYAKKLQEEYQRNSYLYLSLSTAQPKNSFALNSANPNSPNAPPDSYAAPSSSKQSPQDIKRSANVGAKGKLIGGNKADYVRVRISANDLIKLIPDQQLRLAFMDKISFATSSHGIAQNLSGTTIVTNEILQCLRSLNIEGSAIFGSRISSMGLDVVPEVKEQLEHIEVRELANKLDEVLRHIRMLSDQQPSDRVDVAAKPMLPFWKSPAIPLITIDEKLRQLFNDLKEEKYNFTVTLVSGLKSGTNAKIVIHAIVPEGLNEKRATRDLNGLKSDIEKSLKANGYNAVSLITEEDGKTINVTAEPAVLQSLHSLLCGLAQKRPDEIPEDKDEKGSTYNCIVS